MKTYAKTLLLSLFLLTATSASAQNAYANIWVRLIASPDGSGKVWGTLTGEDQQAFAQTYEMKGTIQLVLGFEAIALLYDQPANGYHLAGWYWDVDEDGKLDLNTDILLDFTNNGERTLADWGSDWVGEVYETEEEALAGIQPVKPQLTFIALFTKGANVDVASFTRDLGTVSIDRTINNPGEQVTITAEPYEGFAFESWSNRAGVVVSTDNPYTFTVEGGETYYANFYDPNAPEIEFPAEGGYRAFGFDRTWWLRNSRDAYVVCLSNNDLSRDNGQFFYNSGSEARVQWSLRVNPIAYTNPDLALATIMWGKGKVKFVKYDLYMDHNRENNPVYWSTIDDKPVTRVDRDGIAYYAYVFNEQIGAFIQYGNTDYYKDPNAPTSVTLPRDVAYLWMSAASLSDEEGNIPLAIGLTADAFEKGKEYFLGIEDAHVGTLNVGSSTFYTLSGRRVQGQPTQPGIYVQQGRKVAVK